MFIQALKNLVILSKEEAGAQKIFQGGINTHPILASVAANDLMCVTEWKGFPFGEPHKTAAADANPILAEIQSSFTDSIILYKFGKIQ